MQRTGKLLKNQYDPEALKVPDLLALLAEKDQLLADTQHALDHKNHIIREQQKYITLVEEYLRLAKIRRFGSRSEKLAFQVDLFDEAELEVALGDLEEQLPEEENRKLG